MTRLGLIDLENMGVLVGPKNKQFFSPEFFHHLNGEFANTESNNYLNIIGNVSNKPKSNVAFGSLLNNEIKKNMVKTLDTFLVGKNNKLDVFNPRVIFLKKSLDVTFQAVINYNHSSKSLFDVWELENLFNKANFKDFIAGAFFIYRTSDLDANSVKFLSYQGYPDARTFYSKFGAGEISSAFSGYLEKLPKVKKDELKFNKTKLDDSDEFNAFNKNSSSPKIVKSDVVPSFNYVRVKSDYLKSYEAIYGDKDHEHYINLVDKPLVEKIKGVYDAFDLDKFKIGKEIPEEKILFFLDINFGNSADDLLPFINSKSGKAFMYHGGAPTDFFLKRVFSFKDKIYSVFRDEF